MASPCIMSINLIYFWCTQSDSSDRRSHDFVQQLSCNGGNEDGDVNGKSAGVANTTGRLGTCTYLLL